MRAISRPILFSAATLCLALLAAVEAASFVKFFVGPVTRGDADGHQALFGDLDIYRDAAIRFLANPAALYDRASMLRFEGFIYPPPAILFFVPFAHLAPSLSFLVYSASTIGLGVLAAVVFARLAVPAGLRPLAAMLLIASGPFYANLMAVQFTLWVVFVCIVAIAAALHGRPWVAAVALALACWMKIYPGMLLLAMLLLPAFRPAAVRAVIVSALLPVVLLPVLPVQVYVDFLAEVPNLSAHLLAHIDNGSIAGIADRLVAPQAAWTEYRVVAAQPLVRVLTGLVAIGTLVGIAGRGRRGDGPLMAAFVALATVPLITPQGWTHAFIFAVPLIVFLILTGTSRIGRGVAVLAWLALLMPGYHVFGFLGHAPWLIAFLIYSRGTLATVAVLGVALAARFPIPAPLGRQR